MLDQLLENTARSRPQRQRWGHVRGKDRQIRSLIDWRRDAAEIARQVRAFNPWPIAETRLDGEQLRIYGSKVIAAHCAGFASRNPARSWKFAPIQSLSRAAGTAWH